MPSLTFGRLRYAICVSTALPLTKHPDFLEGVRLFNAGQWWQAHEAWEVLWLRAVGQERHFLQAVILLAAALHKRWYHGSTKHRNYFKAEVYLNRLSAEFGGVDLVALRAQVWAALQGEQEPGEGQRPVVAVRGDGGMGTSS